MIARTDSARSFTFADAERAQLREWVRLDASTNIGFFEQMIELAYRSGALTPERLALRDARRNRAATNHDESAMTIRPALLLPLLLAACAAGVPTDTQPGAPAGVDALAQVGRWKLQSAADGTGRPIAAVLPHGKAVHALVFTEGKLGIEGGCNHIGGRYRIDGRGRLVVSEIQSTLMACVDQDLMTADSAVSALLEGSADWSIAESYPEQLSLQHTDGRRSHWLAVRPAR